MNFSRAASSSLLAIEDVLLPHCHSSWPQASGTTLTHHLFLGPRSIICTSSCSHPNALWDLLRRLVSFHKDTSRQLHALLFPVPMTKLATLPCSLPSSPFMPWATCFLLNVSCTFSIFHNCGHSCGHGQPNHVLRTIKLVSPREQLQGRRAGLA